MFGPEHVAAFVVLAGICFVLPVLVYKGAPFIPTAPRKISRLAKLSGVRPGELAADLGSGDGRMGLALARAGAAVVGYEINPLLVPWSRFVIRLHGQSNRFTVRLKSFWDVDLSPFDVVVVFGAPPMMQRLAEKLKRELKPGARIVSNGCHLPGWEPVVCQDELWLYRR